MQIIKPPGTEKEVQALVYEILKRVGASPYITTMVPYAKTGQADVLATYNSISIAIECKEDCRSHRNRKLATRGANKGLIVRSGAPTVPQRRYLDDERAAGAITLVVDVYNFAGFVEWIKRLDAAGESVWDTWALGAIRTYWVNTAKSYDIYYDIKADE